MLQVSPMTYFQQVSTCFKYHQWHIKEDNLEGELRAAEATNASKHQGGIKSSI